jgi:ankyrin repeat protein
MHQTDLFSSRSDEIVQDITSIHLASLYANLDGIQALFDHCGDKATVAEMVLFRDSAGRLPLHWAAQGAHGTGYRYGLPRNEIATLAINTIKLLLTIDPDTIDVRDYKGYNALWYASSSFKISMDPRCGVMKILLEYGADGSIRDPDGQNLLHLLGFTQNGDAVGPEIIESLVAHGANIEDTDIRGNTPLNQMAINLRQVEAVRALLTFGASMSVKNLRGDTPLHQAAQGKVFSYGNNHPTRVPLDAKIRAQDEMMKVLGEANDKLDSMSEKNADGKTPRQLQEETRNRWLQEEQILLSHMSADEL